ncbi:MAG: TrkA family potassium uptake protein [Spirochaetota bacterium]|nr:TrkA family potassium uptake protein [Spirochaetota bacterium]
MADIDKTFAVLGLSKFGYQAAVSLYQLGAEVIAVDKNEKVIQKIAPYVTQAIRSDVLDWEILEHSGVSNVDIAIIGLRTSFDVAVLLINYLNTKTNVKQIISLVDSDEKAEVVKIIGVTQVIFPEKDSGIRLVKQLIMPGLVDQISISPEATIVEMECPEKFMGYSLIDLKIREKYNIYVIGIIRYNDKSAKNEVLIAPPPNSKFQVKDKIIILGTSENLINFTNMFKKKEE